MTHTHVVVLHGDAARLGNLDDPAMELRKLAHASVQDFLADLLFDPVEVTVRTPRLEGRVDDEAGEDQLDNGFHPCDRASG